MGSEVFPEMQEPSDNLESNGFAAVSASGKGLIDPLPIDDENQAQVPSESCALDCRKKLLAELDEAEFKAIDSLARYKFQMFGYWAAIWVHLNRLSGAKRKSPFGGLVNAARIQREGY